MDFMSDIAHRTLRLVLAPGGSALELLGVSFDQHDRFGLSCHRRSKPSVRQATKQKLPTEYRKCFVARVAITSSQATRIWVEEEIKCYGRYVFLAREINAQLTGVCA